MLKISQNPTSNRCVTLQVEGRILGPWVKEASATFEKILSNGQKIELDLEQVGFVNSDGVALIRGMFSRGVTLVRCSLFVEEQLKGAAITASNAGLGNWIRALNGSGNSVSMFPATKGSLTFAGREKERSQLKSLALQQRHVFIAGPAGIGKSALVNFVRINTPFLLCPDTSKINRILESLEMQLALPSSQLNVVERQNRLLTCLEKRGGPVAFDHISQTSLCIARFISNISDRVPVWIIARSELPHDLGRVWEYLSDFIRLQVEPLKKTETRLLIAQAVMKGEILSNALKHVSSLYKLSKGNPRLLDELLIEYSARK